jgi:hypothetical protein
MRKRRQNGLVCRTWGSPGYLGSRLGLRDERRELGLGHSSWDGVGDGELGVGSSYASWDVSVAGWSLLFLCSEGFIHTLNI